MRRTLLNGPKSQVPRAFEISIPMGFMDTAMRPATSVFVGELGKIAANIRTTTPSQVITGRCGTFCHAGNQWMIRPSAKAVSTM
jgi:hypothetical protein